MRSATKTAAKRAAEAIAGGDIDAARIAVRSALSVLDRAAQKGVIHPNNAARRKSRLFLKFNAAVAALQTPVEPPTTGRTKEKRAAAAPKKGTTRKASKK